MNKKIEQSWNDNAELWIKSVREGLIDSREVITNKAIIEEVKMLTPNRILDMGCGEGWLVRELSSQFTCKVIGVDSCRKLIKSAEAIDKSSSYLTLKYSEIVANPKYIPGTFNVVIFNFSLLDENIVPILKACSQLVTDCGRILIQTLHPWSIENEIEYASGWRVEHFEGLAIGNWKSMPWYFRTLTDWIKDINVAGFRILRCIEPLDTSTQKPASLIFQLEAIRVEP